MAKVLKRTDKMICVRGINIFPEKVEEVLAGIAAVGPGYSLQASGKRGMNDHLTIRIEASPEFLNSPEERRIALKERLRLAFRRAIGIGVEIEFQRPDGK